MTLSDATITRTFLGVCAVIVGLYALDYFQARGLCLSEWRFITDDDIMTGAMHSSIAGRSKRASEITPEERDRIEQYLKDNPGCCRVIPQEKVIGSRAWRGYINVLFGGLAGEVEVKETRLYEGKLYLSTNYYPVDSCGYRALEGLGTTELIKN